MTTSLICLSTWLWDSCCQSHGNVSNFMNEIGLTSLMGFRLWSPHVLSVETCIQVWCHTWCSNMNDSPLASWTHLHKHRTYCDRHSCVVSTWLHSQMHFYTQCTCNDDTCWCAPPTDSSLWSWQYMLDMRSCGCLPCVCLIWSSHQNMLYRAHI